MIKIDQRLKILNLRLIVINFPDLCAEFSRSCYSLVKLVNLLKVIVRVSKIQKAGNDYIILY